MIGKIKQQLGTAAQGRKAQKAAGLVKKYGAITALNLTVMVGTILLAPATVYAADGLSWGDIYNAAKSIGGLLAAIGLVGVALRRLGGPIAEAIPFLASDQFIVSAFIGALLLLNVESVVGFMGLSIPGS